MTPPRLQEVADNVYAYIQPPGGWWMSNAGIIAGRGDGFILIDTAATQARSQALLDTARSVTGQPRVAACVLTHSHGDHAGGLCLLDEAKIFAAAAARDDLADHGLNHWPALFPDVAWGELSAKVPNHPLTPVGEQLTESVPDLFARSLSGPAHSVGDAFAWLPEERVLFAGDLAWWGVTPLCVLGSIARWRAVLDQCLLLGPQVVVSGHGEPSDRQALTRTRDYLDEVAAAAQEAHRRGWSVTETVARTRFSSTEGWLEPERHVVNVHHALAELTGQPVDVARAVGDLVRSHGGKVPTDPDL